MTSPARGRVVFLLAAALSCAFPATAACAGDAASGNAPALPGAAPASAEARNLDEWLAYVAGETITRRMILRDLDERGPDENEASYERRVRDRLAGRVVSGVMLWKARQMGIEVPSDLVEEQVVLAGKQQVARAKERGVDATFEQLLARRGQSLEEFRDLVKREITIQQYWAILLRGVQGKRPAFDPEPSPGESLRLYRDHR